ncbi:hypothetical protein L6R49_04400 [Myxococcota bacterium]|nr:hypothetical protein [Myxococcota bacterium]
MPSFTHECLVDLFRARPQLAAELLAWAGLVRLGAVQEVKMLESSLTVPTPTELRADGVLWVRGDVELSAILEVQLRPDPQKRRSWPLYIASQHARRAAPSVLLVVTLDEATAAWAAAPIHLGPGSVVTPTVFGPKQIPRLLDPALAWENPEAAVLSALAHAQDEDAAKVSLLALQAVQGNPLLTEDMTLQYTELVLSALSLSARALLEKTMFLKSFNPQTEYVKWLVREREEYLSRGIAKGVEAELPKAVAAELPKAVAAELPKAVAAELPRAVATKLAQAEHEIALHTVLDILSARFGEPSSELYAKLSGLTAAQLTALRRPLVTLPSLAELPALIRSLDSAT